MIAAPRATGDRLRRLARLAAGLPGYLARPLDEASATAALRARLDEREERFLAWARELVYPWPESPVRALLLRAGCGFADLASAVRRDGLEPTLGALAAAGVRLSLDEVKGGAPIRREGLELVVSEASFDNPLLAGGLLGRTSGTRGAAARVLYGWDFFAEEAGNELLLYAAHGARRAPGALWLPGPPSISGIHNLLIELKLGRAPERWFSHLPPDVATRAALAALRLAARPYGVRVPHIEATGSGDAARVARWMTAARDRRGGSLLKGFASSAVRVAAAARALGHDLSGCVILAGGEPLTTRRARFVRASGARVHARYVTTETGLVAAACGRDDDDSGGAMHVYTDRLAVVPGEPLAGGSGDARTLLFTTLSPFIGKVLLNADLGDAGRLVRRACDCPFGRLGMELHVADVRSNARLTCEGVTVAQATLDDAVAGVVDGAGVGPDAYQLVEEHDGFGVARLVLRVSPAIGALDPAAIARRVLAELERRDAASAIAARVWRDAGTLHVVRAEPEVGASAKLARVARRVPQ